MPVPLMMTPKPSVSLTSTSLPNSTSCCTFTFRSEHSFTKLNFRILLTKFPISSDMQGIHSITSFKVRFRCLTTHFSIQDPVLWWHVYMFEVFCPVKLQASWSIAWKAGSPCTGFSVLLGQVTALNGMNWNGLNLKLDSRMFCFTRGSSVGFNMPRCWFSPYSMFVRQKWVLKSFKIPPWWGCWSKTECFYCLDAVIVTISLSPTNASVRNGDPGHICKQQLHYISECRGIGMIPLNC